MALKTFRCSNCNEMINTSMGVCRFCATPINHAAAEASAAFMDKINRACSESSYAQIAATGIPIFFAISFVPFFGWVGFIGSLMLLVMVGVMLISWWSKYSGVLKATEPDVQQARRTITSALTLWGIMLVVWLVWFLLLPVVLKSR